MKKLKLQDLVNTLYKDGKIVERKIYPEPYSIIEFGNQLFKITNPGGKGVKVEQLERCSE